MLNWLATNTIEVFYWFLVWNILHFTYIKVQKFFMKGDVNGSGEG